MPPKPKTGSTSSVQPQRPTPHTASPPRSDASSPPDEAAAPAGVTVPPDFKAELLSSLRNEMAAIFKTELQVALSENLSSIKTELLAVKSELCVSITNIQSDVGVLKNTVGEMETSLSTCTDDIATLQAKVECLAGELIKLDNKCDDLEARSWRNNIRIVGVPEDSPNSSTIAAISALLKDALNLDKAPLLDRAHRTLQPKPKPGECPCPIIMWTVSIFCSEPEPNNGSRLETWSSLSSPITLRRRPTPTPPSMTSAASSMRYRGYALNCYTRHVSVLHTMVQRRSLNHRRMPNHSLSH
ncbi:hypothetical protein LDENG_00229480 [Lucifuga dentata]|nr:hypothetical protein LDENG_00229480 [Lucifuga dentata]